MFRVWVVNDEVRERCTFSEAALPERGSVEVVLLALGLLCRVVRLDHNVRILGPREIKLLLQASRDEHLHVFQTAHVCLVRKVRALPLAHAVQQVPPHDLPEAELLLDLIPVTL